MDGAHPNVDIGLPYWHVVIPNTRDDAWKAWVDAQMTAARNGYVPGLQEAVDEWESDLTEGTVFF